MTQKSEEELDAALERAHINPSNYVDYNAFLDAVGKWFGGFFPSQMKIMANIYAARTISFPLYAIKEVHFERLGRPQTRYFITGQVGLFGYGLAREYVRSISGA